jgi:hypothetical protein
MYFFRFFGLFRNRSVCFGCFETGPKHRNKPKKIVIGFAKQPENEPKQIEFRFVSVRTEKKICLFRGHPMHVAFSLQTEWAKVELQAAGFWSFMMNYIAARKIFAKM